MIPGEVRFADVRVQLLGQGDALQGLGAIWIGKTQVRSASLPLRPFAETLFGLRFDAMQFLGVDERDGGVDIRARWLAQDNDWEIRLDHSLDRILNTASWNRAIRASAEITLVLRPSRVAVDGRAFSGFSYAFKYSSAAIPIHLIVDRSTWELNGAIAGCTSYGQLNFQSPTAQYSVESAHSSEGLIDFPMNPAMTHAMPRWAGAPTVDYLFNGPDALAMFYDKVSLIRSVMKKSPGENFLKFFEQHYLDYGSEQLTSARHVLLDSSPKTQTDHQNLWTRWHDYTGNLARAEFGIAEPEYPTVLAQNFWENFTFKSYDNDLLPAARALNYGQVFIDPVWENDMTKRATGALLNSGKRPGNMCCPWEFEIAKVLGGEAGLKAAVDRFHAAGIQVSSWIGSHQSNLYFDPNGKEFKAVALPDGRHQYGSGYDTLVGMDLNSGYDRYLVDRLRHVRQATGIDGFLYDSFYNFGFMPVSFAHMQPRTQAVACVTMLARFAEMGYRMRIESLGPFAQPSHCVDHTYNDDANEFIRYKGNFSPGASPGGKPTDADRLHLARKHFRLLSGKSQLSLPLFSEGRRLDAMVDPLIARANAIYKRCMPRMNQRTILPGGLVLWRDADGKSILAWTGAPVACKVMPGTIARDLMANESVSARGDVLTLDAYRVYEWPA